LNKGRQIVAGMRADLCLLDRPWQALRIDLSTAVVRATFVDGRLIFDRIDQSPQ
jgi:predicted amidohydrolase YtcJ